jgi:diaminopimelate decarboxylase
VAVRVNPDVSAKTHPYISTGLHQHKFGVPIPEALALYAQAAEQPYLTVAGVSVHIGSQITDVDSFQSALERVADLVRVLRQHAMTFAISTPAAAWEFRTRERRGASRSKFQSTRRRCLVRCAG